MNTTYDIGTGFAAGLQQGLNLGLARQARAEARQQELADRAHAEELMRQHRAEQQALESRRFAAANPEAAMAEVGYLRQLGPLPQDAAAMEGIATPLAFANYRDREQAAAERAATLQQLKADRLMRAREQQARINSINAELADRRRQSMANTLGTAAGSLLDSSTVAQTAANLMRNYKAGAVPRPQMDTIEETVTDPDTGRQTKVTRRVPAGTVPAPSAAATAPAGDPRAAKFAGALNEASIQREAATEAARKDIEARRQNLKEQPPAPPATAPVAPSAPPPAPSQNLSLPPSQALGESTFAQRWASLKGADPVNAAHFLAYGEQANPETMQNLDAEVVKTRQVAKAIATKGGTLDFAEQLPPDLAKLYQALPAKDQEMIRGLPDTQAVQRAIYAQTWAASPEGRRALEEKKRRPL